MGITCSCWICLGRLNFLWFIVFPFLASLLRLCWALSLNPEDWCLVSLFILAKLLPLSTLDLYSILKKLVFTRAVIKFTPVLYAFLRYASHSKFLLSHPLLKLVVIWLMLPHLSMLHWPATIFAWILDVLITLVHLPQVRVALLLDWSEGSQRIFLTHRKTHRLFYLLISITELFFVTVLF